MNKTADKASGKPRQRRGKRTRNLFDPASPEPFKLSRTKLDDYMKCPCCFYLDRRLGISRPPLPPFTLNMAVDALFKKEFDIHRANGTAHSLMKDYGVDAVPYSHEKLEEWRNNFKGIRYLHAPTNLEIFGAVDDVWVKPDGTLIIVDYKSTSTSEEINLDDEYKQAFKRQMEVYQWLFRKNGFKVDNLGYFVYANALKDKEAFNKRLEFEVTLIPHQGDDSWVEQIIFEARKCLMDSKIPDSNPDCEYCNYRKAAGGVE